MEENFLEEKKIVLPENDASLQPLGIPRGSVRAILTILLTFSVISFWFLNSFYGFAMPSYLLEIWLVSVGYYVGYRTDNIPIKEIKI